MARSYIRTPLPDRTLDTGGQRRILPELRTDSPGQADRELDIIQDINYSRFDNRGTGDGFSSCLATEIERGIEKREGDIRERGIEEREI